MEFVKIKGIKPASYNPRKLSEEAFVNLKGSIGCLGFILPIIVNRSNMTIVAGHQRTKACTSLGIDEVPCYYIDGCDIQDEVRFNQIHNGVELEPGEKAKCSVEGKLGFFDGLPHECFTATDKNVVVVAEISKLLIKYGNPLCAIVCDGEVVFGNNYVYAAKALNMGVNCSFIDKAQRKMFEYYFSLKYGVFNYEGINRADFVQGLAQPNRHPSIDWSVLYREVVPHLKRDGRNVSILDFGCGKGHFIKKAMMELGIKNSIGLEFFNHNKVGISVEIGNKMIDRLIEFVKHHGKFDYVICDAVINSVNTQEAEDSVMACLNLFCKNGGKIFYSGRRREFFEDKIDMKYFSGEQSMVKFFDEYGLTSIMREGQWFFQKFLYEHQVSALNERFKINPFLRYNKSGYFGVGGTKSGDLSNEEYKNAIEYEFNLMLPNGRRYNRQHDILELFGLSK